MNKSNTSLPTTSRVKQRAKKLKKEQGISHSEALKIISNELGFDNWQNLQEELKKREQISLPIASPSNNFIEYEDVEMSDEDYEILDNERTEDLSGKIKERVLLNKRYLTKIGAEYSIFEPTHTGLAKSILDAIQQVRTHFEEKNFHLYLEQGQGPEHKVKKVACFLTDDKIIKSTLSLYRPKTKKGDPRMWFRKLGNFVNPCDQVAIIIHNDIAYLINLSNILLTNSIDLVDSEIKLFLENFSKLKNKIADELLRKLRKLAKNPLPALRSGDTAIGYTLETNLGIAANSSKLPDYYGIELKSGRGVKTRTTLFAQVADWTLSKCKKSVEILNKYGYKRGGGLQVVLHYKSL